MTIAPVLQPISGNWNFVGLDWSGYPDPVDTFTIYRKLAGESSFVAITTGLTQQKIHSNFHPSNVGDVVQYRITATFGGQESEPSNTQSYTVPPTPDY